MDSNEPFRAFRVFARLHPVEAYDMSHDMFCDFMRSEGYDLTDDEIKEWLIVARRLTAVTVNTQKKYNESLIAVEPHISCRYIFHQSKSDWGGSILIMEKTGKAFARIYWFDDDDTTVYLDWLDVNEEERRKGIGLELQEIREEMGRKFGAKTACLWVDKDSWMHEWYKRRGYEDWQENKNQNNAIWMSKSLINGR